MNRSILLAPSSRLQKPLPTAKVIAEPCYGFLVVVLPVLLLELLCITCATLYVCPILLCITCFAHSWLEAHHVVLNKTLDLDHLRISSKEQLSSSDEHHEHIQCLRRTPVTITWAQHISSHLALIYNRARQVGEMKKASCSKRKFLGLVFQFKVTMVEIVNEQVLQMFVSGSVDVAFSVQPQR